MNNIEESLEIGGSSIYFWRRVKDGGINRNISWKFIKEIVRFLSFVCKV